MGFFKRFSKKKEDPNNSTVLVPGVGRLPYPAYRGKEPYIFVSYCHADADDVYAEIKRFNEAGFRVWYDEGIAPGNEWTDEIVNALENCALFVVFLTRNSVKSPNVADEINFVIDEGTPAIAVYLEECELIGGLKLRFKRKQAIMKYMMSEEEYNYKYVSAFERLGLRRVAVNVPAVGIPSVPAASAPVQPAAPVEGICHDSPEDAKKRANGDLVRVDGYDIEHGSLRGYFGTDKDLRIPNSAAVIRSTAFKNCRLFVESIDLNRAGCVLDYAFENCPRLHTIKVPPTVTTFKPNAIVNCPNVTLYIRRNQLPEGYEERFTGKKIVYLDEPAAKQPLKTTPSKIREEQAKTLLTGECKTEDYVPKGTAYITTVDGNIHIAIANSLIFYSKYLWGYGHVNESPFIYSGLQTIDGEDGEKRGEMVYFADMKAVGRNGDKLIVTDIDGEKTEIELEPYSEIWYIGEADSVYPSVVRSSKIEKITFDRKRTPPTDICYGRIVTTNESFLSPISFIWLFNRPSMREPYYFTKDLSSISSVPLSIKRLKKLTVTKNGTDSSPTRYPTDMEMTATLKNGEEAKVVVTNSAKFYVMTANGAKRILSRENLKGIDFMPFVQERKSPEYKRAANDEPVQKPADGSDKGPTPLSSFRIDDNGAIVKYIGNAENVVIPESDIIKSIGAYAFEGCDIKSVFIPGSIVSIGSWAFSECKRLKVVVISEGVKELGGWLFFGSSPEYVKLPASVTHIDKCISDDPNTKHIVRRGSYAMEYMLSYSDLDTTIVD